MVASYGLVMARQSRGIDELRQDLVGAIERGEFRLEFQPVVRLGGGTVAHAAIAAFLGEDFRTAVPQAAPPITDAFPRN